MLLIRPLVSRCVPPGVVAKSFPQQLCQIGEMLRDLRPRVERRLLSVPDTYEIHFPVGMEPGLSAFGEELALLGHGIAAELPAGFRLIVRGPNSRAEGPIEDAHPRVLKHVGELMHQDASAGERIPSIVQQILLAFRRDSQKVLVRVLQRQSELQARLRNGEV